MLELRTLYMVGAGSVAATLLLIAVALSGTNRPNARPAVLLSPSHELVAAPGRVEPITGEIHVGSALMGKLSGVFVREGDRVEKNALLAQLEDGEYRARYRSAAAEVGFRQSERDSALGGGSSDKAEAAASVGAAEKEVAAARAKLDDAMKADLAGAVADARKALAASESTLVAERRNLGLVRTMSKPSNASRTESALSVARAAMAEAEAQLDKTNIRSPIAGAVLRTLHHDGEIVGGTPDDVLFVVGDISRLRVHAQIDERDIARIAVGQSAYVTATAFGERHFSGHLAQIGLLANRKTLGRDAGAASDASGLDVYVVLDDAGMLVSGMRVDVFIVPR